MSEPRVIRKYPNRRLYDSTESRYVTLADIRKLVIAGEEFVVLDKVTNDDITRSVLLQIIADQEQHGAPVMSQDFLSQLIRSYGSAMQGFVGGYLEQSMQLLLTQQQQARDRLRESTGIDLGDVTDMAERNLKQWRSMQEQWLQQMFGATTRRNDDT